MSDVFSALAETPEEIALRIMAEVFQVVRGGSGKGLS